MKHIIAIACHFKSENEICETTAERLNKSLEIAKEEDIIVVTGDVPYKIGTKTVAELSREYLIKKGFPENRVVYIFGGVGTFSEARIACSQFQGKELVIVSSSWYLFQAKPIFKRRARENNTKISFVTVKNTAGIQTWITYIILAVIVRLSILLGLEKYFENIMTGWQQNRKNGFIFNGCK